MTELEELRFSLPLTVAEAVANLLTEHGHGVEQRDGETLKRAEDGTCDLVIWLPASQVDERVAQVSTLLESLTELGVEISPWEYGHQPVDPDDWKDAYKSFFPVVRLGKFVVIKPSWRDYDPEPDDRVIEMDPGMAFGTGLHASTALAVEILERINHFDRPPTRVVDVGTGTGILSLAAARFWNRARVIALDSDPTAVEICRENVDRNDLSDRIQVLHQSIGEFHEPPPAPPPPPERFGGVLSKVKRRRDDETQPVITRPSSLVLANLTHDLLTHHLDRIRDLIRDTGSLVLSGLLDEEATEICRLYCGELRLEPEFSISADGWRAWLLKTLR